MLDVLTLIALLCQIHPTNMEMVKYQEVCQQKLLSCYEQQNANANATKPDERGILVSQCLKLKEGAK